MHMARVCLVLGVSVLCVRPIEAGTNLIVNGSFETEEVTVGGEPRSYGDWEGDFTDIVGAENGVAPADGARMLRFIYTLRDGPNAVSGQSNLWQVIDVSAHAQQIAEGHATARATMKVNRIALDAQTDTQFDVRLGAYDGLANSFPEQNEHTELVQQLSSVFSDADTATWETVTVELPLPANTDFIAIALAAVEDVYNDGDGDEFDGHYCDDVQVTIIPEPSSYVLLLTGGMGLLVCSRRRRRFSKAAG